MSISTHVLTQHLATWFETLSPHSLGQIEQFYETDAYFKDPFNEVCDVARIQLIFQDMFTEFEQPRFVIQEQICDDDKRQSVLTWHFLFNWRSKAWCIVGSSHLRFGSTGLVIYHRDYWDASEELYEKLPVIGFVLKALKKRAQK
jgi:hypothetical protein